MPLQAITLTPGVDTEKTASLNEAGVISSQLVRYKESLIQKLGGWDLFCPTQVTTGVGRDVHAFQGLNQDQVLGIGATDSLKVFWSGTQGLSGSPNVLNDITPQYALTNSTPSFSVTAGSCTVTIIDYGSPPAPSVYNTVYVATPVAVGGILLVGAYQVIGVLSSYSYQIYATGVASASVSSGGTLPYFYTTANSAIVDVIFPNIGGYYTAIQGLYYRFGRTTSVGGQTISGNYQVTSIIDSTHFQIGSIYQSSTTVSSAAEVPMNGGNAGFNYYITLGPPPLGGGFGEGSFGSGLFGSGSVPPAGTGTPFNANLDWILDNNGSFMIATPKLATQGGPIFYWSPDYGLATASILPQGPIVSGGCFMGMPTQQVIAWGSEQDNGNNQFTGVQDPLLVRWSDIGNMTQWAVAPNTAAGSFRIPTGSAIIGALQAPLFGCVWTDIDMWIMQYIGQPLIFSFSRVGTGCGLLGAHAADVQQGSVYWAGRTQFYVLGPNGVQVLPCSVWDYFYQQLDPANSWKVRCASNTAFNEISWYFPILPSLGGTGENTNYVKLHQEGTEYEWDYGVLSRTSWVDSTILGGPIGTDNLGNLVQHETSNDASGAAIQASFRTGWFLIGDGSQLAFVDWILPDMKWGLQGGAQTATMQFTFFVVDYPGDTPRSYGPYAVTQQNRYINVRMRGRYFAVLVQSADQGSFWRLGKINFRWAPAGRR
jgi:hypothetical protein